MRIIIWLPLNRLTFASILSNLLKLFWNFKTHTFSSTTSIFYNCETFSKFVEITHHISCDFTLTDVICERVGHIEASVSILGYNSEYGSVLRKTYKRKIGNVTSKRLTNEVGTYENISFTHFLMDYTFLKIFLFYYAILMFILLIFLDMLPEPTFEDTKTHYSAYRSQLLSVSGCKFTTWASSSM